MIVPPCTKVRVEVAIMTKSVDLPFVVTYHFTDGTEEYTSGTFSGSLAGEGQTHAYVLDSNRCEN